MTLSADTRTSIEQARDRYPQARSAVLPALWAVQHEIGHLSPEGMAEVAELLRLPASEVEAVATFYSMYFQKPHGQHEVLVCVNVSCALRGADQIVESMEQLLGCPSGSTTADGMFTWSSTIECLGACGGAPSMQVDHRFHENLTAERIASILDVYRAAGNGHAAPAGDAQSGAMVMPPGPQTKHQRGRRGQPDR